MKILNVCLTGPFTEGYAYQDNLLTKYFSLYGNECTIVSNAKQYNKGKVEYVEVGRKIINNNIELIRLDYKKRIPTIIAEKLRIYSGLSEVLENLKPDLIFIHGIQFWDVFKIIKYVKVHKEVKIIVDNHADFSNSATNFISKNILHKIIWRYCAKSVEPYTEVFYGVLPARVDFLNKLYGIDKEKIRLLPMGADTEKIDFKNKNLIRKSIREKYNINEKDFLLVTGGKIDIYKKQILELMKFVKYNKDNIKILVFGDVVDELKEKFERYIDNDKVIYIGWLNSEEVYNYFLSADLGVFPGRHSVLWEQAVGCGLPCIFKYIEGTQHIDLNGNCEFIYEDNIEELKEIINNIKNDEKKYNKMKKVSQVRGIDMFSYKRIAEDCIQFLDL